MLSTNNQGDDISRILAFSAISVLIIFQSPMFLQSSGGSDGKASAYNAEDPGSIPGLGRSPGEGNGNPLQYFCLENPMDGGAWRAAVHRVAKSWTQQTSLDFNVSAVSTSSSVKCAL